MLVLERGRLRIVCPGIGDAGDWELLENFLSTGTPLGLLRRARTAVLLLLPFRRLESINGISNI